MHKLITAVNATFFCLVLLNKGYSQVSKPFYLIQQIYHDGGSQASNGTFGGLFNAASFFAVLTPNEMTYLTSHHDAFFYNATPYDLVNAGYVKPHYPQTDDTDYSATMKNLVSKYGFENIYQLAMPEWDNDPANQSWASNRFHEAGVAGTRPDIPTGLTRQQAYTQWMHFYGSQNHDGITDHQQLGAFVGQGAVARGWKVSTNNANGGTIPYALQLGVDLVTVQVQNDDISGIIGKIAMARGGATQYGKQWGIDLSHWRSWGPRSGATFYSAGSLSKGWTDGMTRVHLFLSFGAGAQYIVSEPIQNPIEGSATGQHFNPTGLVFQQFMNYVTSHPNRGTSFVPVAFVRDHNTFLEPPYGQWNQGRAVWYSQMGANAGEKMLYNLWSVAYPNANTWGSATDKSEPMGFARWGETIDLLTDSAGESVLSGYKVIVLSTFAIPSGVFLNSLMNYVNSGGTLIINANQLDNNDPAFKTLTGLTLDATTATASAITWNEDATGITESLFRYNQATLAGAGIIAHTGTSTPIITVNNVGSGKVYTLLAQWGSNMGNTALLSSTTRLLDKLQGINAPARVNTITGECDYTISTLDSLTIVTVVNTGTSTWTGNIEWPKPAGTYTVSEWVKNTTLSSSIYNDRIRVESSITSHQVFSFVLTNISVTGIERETVNNSLKIYPNPSSGDVSVSYSLIVSSIIIIDVVDVSGKEVKRLLKEKQSSGTHQLNFNMEGMHEGIYFIKAIIDRQEITKKFLIIKN